MYIDGLVLQHQDISSYRAEYTPMHNQLFMGWYAYIAEDP